MSSVAYAQKILQERGDAIRFIRAVENDKPCWFYLRIHPEKLVEYEQKLKTGSFNIREYGQILESDWGDYPEMDVIGFMKDEYDFDTPNASN